MSKTAISTAWSRARVSDPSAVYKVWWLTIACLLLSPTAPTPMAAQSTYMRRNADGSIEFSNAPTNPSFQEHGTPGRTPDTSTTRNVTPEPVKTPDAAREHWRELRDQRDQEEVQAAVNTLKSRDDVVYINGISKLQRMGPAVVPPLLELLRVPDGRVRAGAASALAPLNRRSDAALTEQTVTALTRALDDAMPAVRRNAAESLIEFRSQARPAVQPLTNLLNDEDPDVRFMAARALAAIGPDAAAAVPELLKALNDPRRAWGPIRDALERIGTEQAKQGLADFDRTPSWLH